MHKLLSTDGQMPSWLLFPSILSVVEKISSWSIQSLLYQNFMEDFVGFIMQQLQLEVEPHHKHCVESLNKTFYPLLRFNPGNVPPWLKNCCLGCKATNKQSYKFSQDINSFLDPGPRAQSVISLTADPGVVSSILARSHT